MNSSEISSESLIRILENNKRLVALGDRKSILDFLLDETIKLARAERGFVIFFSGNDYSLASARNFDGEALKMAQQKFSKTILQQMRSSGKALVLLDAMQDSRLQESKSLLDMALRSILCVPIRLGEEWLGAIYLDNRFQAGAFSENSTQVVSLFADQVALSLKALQNLEQSEAHAQELEVLQRQLARLNENLHDEVQRTRQERDQAMALLDSVPEPTLLPGIIGRSKTLRRTIATIRQLKNAEPTVYIHGESGTGKELMARALHQNSPRAKEPFLAINCAAFSEAILDSELFGHVKGAFTGADRDRTGLFASADRGTIFLDEVGDMPSGMQAKLLRVLQEGEIRPVGSNRNIKVSVRILAASNRDLKTLMTAGSFREDLYYRLNVVRLDLPPLRERVEDIPHLAQHFMRHNSQGIPEALLAMDEAAMEYLIQYPWPGNIRELQNEVERALILGKGHIKVKNLSPHLVTPSTQMDMSHDAGMTEQIQALERRLLVQALETSHGNKKTAAAQLKIPRTKLYQLIKKYQLGYEFGQVNLRKVKQALRKTKGNKSRAAERLGISRRTLYEILNRA